MASKAEPVTFAKFEPYRLPGIRVTDNELGHGSYATVLELDYMGLRCAGKKIHEVLINQGDTSYTVRRFEEECRLLSRVRHPNIVQFLGVHFQEGVPAPVLVMEFLHTNLTTCIEHYGILPKEISYSILHDVALGLCYLHSQTPPIIHRDLSSNNVLLTANMTAKISDLGVARMHNLTAQQLSQLTQVPGTIAFMPPEVMEANPNYNTSVDEFSYGILMIHTLSGMWPEPQVGPTRTVEGELVPVSEAERRDLFLGAIGNDHPLYDLIMSCISNNPQARTSADVILSQISEMLTTLPYEDTVEMLKCIDDLKTECARIDAKIQQKEIQLLNMRREFESIIRRQSAEAELKEMIHSTEIERLHIQIKHEGTARELAESEREVANKRIMELESEMETKMTILKEKDAEYCRVNGRLKETLAYLQLPKEITMETYLRIEQKQDIPVAMCSGQSVVISGVVYFGGGETKNADNSYIIQSYDLSKEKWTTLPVLSVRYFGLGQINGKLVVVGGEKYSSKYSTMVRSCQVLMLDGKSWKKTIPSMATARLHPTVISHKLALIVAGGWHFDQVTKTVEIFQVDEFKWYSAASLSLPVACFGASAVISSYDQKCYIVGGEDGFHQNLNMAMYASIDDLLVDVAKVVDPVTLPRMYREQEHISAEYLCSKAASLKMHQSCLSPWKMLSDTLTHCPTVGLLAGSLITLGGQIETSEGSSTAQTKIHKYVPLTETWIPIGDLPAPRVRTAVAALSPAQILVIGGSDGGNAGSASFCRSVYKISLYLK